MALNKTRVEVLGNLTHFPELKTTSSGKRVLDLTLAVNQSKDGDADFVRVSVWGAWAENLIKTAGKGALVYVEGRLRSESWKDKETGENRSRLSVVADQAVHFEQPRAEASTARDKG